MESVRNLSINETGIKFLVWTKVKGRGYTSRDHFYQMLPEKCFKIVSVFKNHDELYSFLLSVKLVSRTTWWG